MDKYKELAEILDGLSLPFDGKNICDRSKELIIIYGLIHDDLSDYFDYFGFLDNCNSPVEQIFYTVYILYCGKFKDIKIDNFDFSFLLLEEIKQQEIVIFEDKKYSIDFVIDFSRTDKNGEYFYPTIKDLKYAIEIDGFDYHSSKKQMSYDYERENNLKLKGYNVIRFTGSQLYKEPFKCVDKLIRIIVKDVLKEIDKKYE